MLGCIEDRYEAAIMIIVNALRDFADGLSRGLSRYLTERNEFTATAITPSVKSSRPER